MGGLQAKSACKPWGVIRGGLKGGWGEGADICKRTIKQTTQTKHLKKAKQFENNPNKK